MSKEKEYHAYLKLEKGLSPNSVEAYEQDLEKLRSFCEEQGIDMVHATPDDLHRFVMEVLSSITNARSQARILSGIHSYYRFLVYHNYIEQDPVGCVPEIVSQKYSAWKEARLSLLSL